MSLTLKQSEELEYLLKDRGYTKYIQNYKNNDWTYWKSFERIETGIGGYSVGICFYDFGKYPQHTGNPILISFEYMLGTEQKIGRMDLSISDDNLTINEFEKFCKELYEFYKKSNLNK